MTTNEQRQKAGALRALHSDDGMLVLLNVWDPIGARILEAKGFPAIATASAAVSAALGYADGERLQRATMIEQIGRISRAVRVPVTADIESGYGEDPAALAETVRLVVQAGAVGINLEDSVGEEGLLRAKEEQCERIAVARDAATRMGIPVVINARIDAFLGPRTFEDALQDAIDRAAAYIAAGADCVYPIGPGGVEEVAKLRRQIAAPINILGTSSGAPLAKLRELGVNRVSFGPLLFRSLTRQLADIADGVLAGKEATIFGRPLTGAELDAYLESGHEPPP